MTGNSKLVILTPVSDALADYLPHPDQGLPAPTPPAPDNTLPPVEGGGGFPPRPSHPIYYPDAEPSHPIVLPPVNPDDLPHPDHTLPGPGSAGGEHPDNTLPIPPEVVEAPDRFEMKVGWTEETGWIVVFVPTGEHATPSKRKA